MSSFEFVVGHRGNGATGESPACPENTLFALRAGLAAGMNGVETDVQLTSDGRFVLFHGDELADGRATFDVAAEELMAMDFGAKHKLQGDEAKELDLLEELRVTMSRSPSLSLMSSGVEEDEEGEEEEQDVVTAIDAKFDAEHAATGPAWCVAPVQQCRAKCVPSLEEWLKELVDHHAALPSAERKPFKCILELKSTKFAEAGPVRLLIDALVDWLEPLAKVGVHVTLSSFCHDALMHAHEYASSEEVGVRGQLRLALLFNRYNKPLPSDYLATVASHHGDEVHCGYFALDADVVSAMHAANLQVMAWVPHSHALTGKQMDEQHARLQSIGVDIMCCDHLDRLIN
eukprot:TRINITY_DN65737_c4_g1_i3.p2 TRINITY_DN65737_c4_g1~~TRINITY_DN65737_c4_g1_i3.p2  ORF type:complete len:345 (+),score=172.56 TRINITY_DN65737_c4_g1_i3:169-1203(+)